MKYGSSILSRYLSKEIVRNFLPIFVIFLLIIGGNQFFLVINQSLKEGFYSSEVFSLIGLKVIRDLPFVIVLSFSLSITYSLNRLYKNSEISILHSSGLSELDLLKNIKSIVVILLVIVFSLSSTIVPFSKSKIDIYKKTANLRPEYIFLKAGIFQNFHNDNITFYASEIVNLKDDQQKLKKVFLHSKQDNKVISADSGIKTKSNTGDVVIDLFNGNIYSNLKQEFKNNLEITSFEKLTLVLFSNSNHQSLEKSEQETKNIYELFTNVPNDFKELMHRFLSPVSLLLMSFISVFLSRINTRENKNYSIGVVLIIYISYYNIMIYFNKLDASSMESVFLYFIIPHIVMFLLNLTVYMKRNFYY